MLSTKHKNSRTILPSNKSFGLTFSGIFVLISAIFWWQGIADYEFLLLAAFITSAVTFLFPQALTPFNFIWMKFGELLHSIVSPVIVGVIYFGLITPIGFLMRIAKRDVLKRKIDVQSETYWEKRENATDDNNRFDQQF